MRSLVIGFGSIGQRHHRILTELGHKVAVVSSRTASVSDAYDSITSALLDFNPSYVVISSPTSRHLSDFHELTCAQFTGRILIEKPLSVHESNVPPSLATSIHIGYNLRYLPVIQRLRELTQRDPIVSLSAYNGEYLPNWRPGRDYRLTSSASAAMGGGVLRDQSHELDFIHYLMGAPVSVVADIQRLGDLEIDTEDTVRAIMRHNTGSISSLYLSYLDRVRRRELTCVTNSHTISIDLVAGTLTVDGRKEESENDRDTTFRRMHIDILSGKATTACTLPEASDVMRTIAMLESSTNTRAWVRR